MDSNELLSILAAKAVLDVARDLLVERSIEHSRLQSERDAFVREHTPLDFAPEALAVLKGFADVITATGSRSTSP